MENPIPIIRGEKERKIRSVVKAISHRLIGTINTFAAAWLFTRSFSISLKVVLVREIIATVIFFFHERIWNNIRWGKFRLEKLINHKFVSANQNTSKTGGN